MPSCCFCVEVVEAIWLCTCLFSLANLPPQPTAFAVDVLSSRSVRVSWNELEPGDNAADSFTIEYKKTGGSESDWEKRTDISDYSAEVDGLMPNREYKFRVFGVNKAGSGPKTGVVTKRTLEDGED